MQQRETEGAEKDLRVDREDKLIGKRVRSRTGGIFVLESLY